MKKLILFFAIATSMVAYGRNDSISNSFTSDFNMFVRLLEETHPDPYTGFGGKMNFRSQVQTLRSGMEQVTDSDQFKEILTGFIAQLEDGHTFINSGNQAGNQQTNNYLPLAFKVATDGLFVGSTTKEYSLHAGSKLLAVNNIPVDELLQKIKKLEGAENKYGAMNNLCNWIVSQHKAERLLGQMAAAELKLQNTQDEVYHLTVSYGARPEWAPFESGIIIAKDNELLYSDILEKENVGYLAWNSVVSREVVEGIEPDKPHFKGMMNWAYSSMQQKQPEDSGEAVKNIPGLYETFFSLLTQMEDRKARYLIIDLRNNSGGMTPLCRPVLYMLYGDDYLNYHSDAQYNRLISPLLLKKWNLNSIEDYNKEKNTNYVMGDYIFGEFFPYNEKLPIEEKRKDFSLITYNNGIGKEYTENLEGIPVYRPHVIVLCSPQTFSAAYHFIYMLTKVGHATVVGVPSRQAGNAFMETTMFELPFTKLNCSISNSAQVMFPNDPEKGKVFMPDFPMTWKDYAKYNFDKNAEILYCIDLINQGKITLRE